MQNDRICLTEGCLNFILFLKLINLFIYFYFALLYWFCHTSTCIRHGCTRVCELYSLNHNSNSATGWLYDLEKNPFSILGLTFSI